MKQIPPRETNQTEQQTGVPIESDIGSLNTPTNITEITAQPETTLPPLHKVVVKEPHTKVQQTTDIKTEKDATMRSAREPETNGAFPNNQCEHKMMKDKSLQPEEKLKTATCNETRIRNHEASVKDNTVNTNKADKERQEKQKSQGSMKRGPEHFSRVMQGNR